VGPAAEPEPDTVPEPKKPARGGRKAAEKAAAAPAPTSRGSGNSAGKAAAAGAIGGGKPKPVRAGPGRAARAAVGARGACDALGLS
jgi:hypothetical protein